MLALCISSEVRASMFFPPSKALNRRSASSLFRMREGQEVIPSIQSQLLGHEVVPVSGRMVLQRSKNAIPEFFVKGSCLKTKSVEECVSAAALDSIELRTFHQLLAKPLASRGRSHRKCSDMEPCRPDISEQTAQ